MAVHHKPEDESLANIQHRLIHGAAFTIYSSSSNRDVAGATDMGSVGDTAVLWEKGQLYAAS